MKENLNFSINLTTQDLLEKLNFLMNSVENQFYTFKLFVSKCPNYGRGRGVQTKSKLFASIQAKGRGVLDNVHNFMVFYGFPKPYKPIQVT